MKWIALFAAMLVFSGCVFNTPWGDFKLTELEGAPSGGEASGGGAAPGGDEAPPSGEEDGGAGTGEAAPADEGAGEVPPPEEPSGVITATGPTVVYFEPGAGGFLVEIDGIATSYYDRVGVVLRPGESADPSDFYGLFIGDYPTHSPRDVVITSRVTPGNRELEMWRKQATDGDLERKYFSVIVLNSDREQEGRINFGRAWPSSYGIAVTSGTFEETVVLSSESVDRAD